MKVLHFLLTGLLLAAGLQGTTLPAYANGNNCLFQSKGLSISFGALNPASGSDVVVPASGATAVGDCAPGQTMTISGDNGVNYLNGTRNLRITGSGDLIPYSLSLPFTASGPGNGNYISFPFNGSILWSAYANASVGSYTDQVIISVTP